MSPPPTPKKTHTSASIDESSEEEDVRGCSRSRTPYSSGTGSRYSASEHSSTTDSTPSPSPSQSPAPSRSVSRSRSRSQLRSPSKKKPSAARKTRGGSEPHDADGERSGSESEQALVPPAQTKEETWQGEGEACSNPRAGRGTCRTHHEDVFVAYAVDDEALPATRRLYD